MIKVTLIFWAIFNVLSVVGQNNTIAKFKYEEAEQAFVNEDYSSTLTKLDESEKLFGKINPPIMYLRIMAQNNLLSDNPHDDVKLLLALHKNCKLYLKEYANISDVEDKYREVYKVSDYIKIYSDNPDFFKVRSLYYGTKDEPKNITKAYELCLKLANEGNDHAMNMLAIINFDKKDEKEAINWFQKAADRGNVYGLSGLAYAYYYGYNVNQDYKKALKLYQQAANKGYPHALEKVGDFYFYGYGNVPIDYAEAFKWYQKGADKKNAASICNIGYMYDTGQGVEKNKILASELYQKSANLGNATAMNNLANKYYYGVSGLSKNHKEALTWYLKAAQYGNRDRFFRIASMYHEGEGIEKDYNEAYNWYLKAADDGNSDAMVQIGVLFSAGFISKNMSDQALNTVIYPKDFTESIRWFLLAADKNNSTAMKHLATYYTYGFGVKKDKKLAKEWNEKAAVAEIKNKK